MKRWISLNMIFVILVLMRLLGIHEYSLWKLWAIVFACLALISFMINWNMYLMFKEIREGKNKQRKKNLVKYSRKLMKVHHYIGLVGFGFIFLHGGMMLTEYVNPITSVKVLSGMLALLLLIILLLSGWYRRKKATKKRRRLHITMAGVFLISVVIHLLS